MTTYQKYGVAIVLIGAFGVASFAVAQTINGTMDTTGEDNATSTTNAATTTGGTDQLAPNQSNATTAPNAANQVYPAPMVVDINNTGEVLIRGTLQTTGTSTVSINSWGGTWNIRVGANSTVIPQGAGTEANLSAFSEGDFIGVAGRIATDQPNTVDATLVRDWTTNPYNGGTSATSQPATSAGEPSTSGTLTPDTGGVSGTGAADTNTGGTPMDTGGTNTGTGGTLY